MEDFVTYDQAVKLKELGFDWETFGFYLGATLNTKVPSWKITNTTDLPIVSAPTLYQAQKWLREKQNLFVISDVYFKNGMDNNYTNPEYEYIIVILRDVGVLRTESGSLFPQRLFTTYEQALSAGIYQALRLIKR